MPTFSQNLRTVTRARARLDKAQERQYQARLNVQKSRNPTTLESVRADLAASTTAVKNSERALSAAIKTLHGTADHRKIARQLNADFPVVLFPVRIETRFITVGRRQELWLRVYPDDIHVHSFESRLTVAEIDAGKSYWLTLNAANRDNLNDIDTIKEEAWSILSRKAGVQRALWIAKQTQPVNWTPMLAVADENLEFPSLGDNKIHDWTRAPQTQLLPDKFVVHIYKGDELVRFKVGKPVPDTVFMGPDPFLAEEAFRQTGKNIEFDESFAWTSEFEQAVAKGLGFKIPIDGRMLNHGKIDRITVMGLLASATPNESQRLLEEHILAHRYSRKGFSFLPQGTPTNNTTKSESAYIKNYDELPKGYYDGSESTPLSSLTESDGFVFAQALGINPDVLSDAKHADKDEASEAKAMNEALYPATIGHFLEVLSKPAVSDSAQPKVRQFFTDFVSATGSLPSIRVGDQPYGTLLTSDMQAWKEPGSDQFFFSLNLILKLLQSKWNTIKDRKVAHVSKRGDASTILLEIMGLSPGSVTFKQRLAHLNDMPLSATNIRDAEGDFTAKQNRVMGFFRSAGYGANGFPLVSSLSFYNRKSQIPYNHMVDRKPPSPTRFLDRLGPRKLNFIRWLAQVRSTRELEDHTLPGARPPRSVLYFLLRHSLLLSLQKAAVRMYQKGGIEFKRVANEKSLYNFNRKIRDLTTWEILRGVPLRVDPQKLNINKPMGDHLLTMASNRPAVANLNRVRRALKKLTGMSTARLHQCLADHIDLCSYRLDAWQTGLFYRRLKAKRKRNPKGVYLGAYGWIENLKIEPKRQVRVPAAIAPERSKPVFQLSGNAGFVHTPSLNHATAAGVLHAGYRNHADAGNPDAFAVNLSSERVRRGLYLYEGVQNNQPLEALLGYQFERALHDSTTRNPSQNMNQYILELREKFPIDNASIPQQGTEAQETVPTYPVVNGLKIIAAKAADFRALGIPAVHLPLIMKEKDRLEDSLDAVGDLLTSEAAFQLVQGKTDRTAGVLNSFKDIHLPPDLEVNRTPRSTHLSVNSKLCLGFANLPGLPAGSGWGPGLTPRSRTEPGINSWLAGQIGNPERILCAVTRIDEDGTESNSRRIKLSDLGIQPIDFVYTIGVDVKTGAKDLERLIYREYTRSVTVPDGSRVSIQFDLPDLAARDRSFAQVLPLAGYLRLLITTGRPASAKDFQPQSREVSEAADELFAWDVEDLKTRVDTIIRALEELQRDVGSKAPNSRQPKTRANPATLRELFGIFFAEGKPVEWLEAIPITQSTIDALMTFIESAPLYGIKASHPERVDKDQQATVVALLMNAANIWKNINTKLAHANAKLAEATVAASEKVAVNRLVDAAKAALGDDFVILPGFFFKNGGDVRASLAQGGKQLLKFYSERYATSPKLAVETWMESLSPVRPAVNRLEQIRIISEFHTSDELEFTAVQLPFKEKDSWLAVEFPEIDESSGEPFSIKEDTLSICISGLDPVNAGRRQQILVVDEWTEAVPNPTEVTGIAYNYNQPNNCAPNAVLVAVEPTGDRHWDWDVLTGILDDTLRRAKTRAVEPAHLLEDTVLDVLLPMTIAGFDVHDANISLDFLATNDALVKEMQRQKFNLYKGL